MNAAPLSRRTMLSLTAAGAAAAQTSPAETAQPAAPAKPSNMSKPEWYKGNLHTHTLNSDGDSTPQDVATWYRERGYHFLSITDHNHLTDITGLNAVLASKEKFLLIPGEEVTDRFGPKHVHLNAINVSRLVTPTGGKTIAETIENNYQAIRETGALAVLNHPNFHWSVAAADMLKTSSLSLFEIYNGHPTVNNVGGGGFVSAEEMWDQMLSAGRKIYGTAVDDAHFFKRFAKDVSNGGRAWVQVRAPELSAAAITKAIAAGDFYASTGVVLKDIQMGSNEIGIAIDVRPQEKLTTSFIGNGGKVLATSFDGTPVYKLKGNEKYVRARIESSFGLTAWTQPYFL